MTSGSVTVSPKPGWKPSRVKLARKARLRTGDAEIGDHRQAKPAADRRAVDRGDDRLLGAEQPVAFDIERLHAGHRLARAAAFFVERRAVAEIGAGAERLALRRQHDGADVDVLVEGFEGAGDVLDQRNVEEIIGRPPDLDQRRRGRLSRCRYRSSSCPSIRPRCGARSAARA